MAKPSKTRKKRIFMRNFLKTTKATLHEKPKTKAVNLNATPVKRVDYLISNILNEAVDTKDMTTKSTVFSLGRKTYSLLHNT